MTALEIKRLNARLTRQQLAEKSGVSYLTILNIEEGKNEPHDSTLFKLADALGVEPTDLLATDGSEPTGAAA